MACSRDGAEQKENVGVVSRRPASASGWCAHALADDGERQKDDRPSVYVIYGPLQQPPRIKVYTYMENDYRACGWGGDSQNEAGVRGRVK